jgi:osmotically inducible lipoprotein OsmB
MGRTMLLAAAAMFAPSACGTTPGDRAVSGGLLGAGAGAAIGSLAGNAGTGAAIGGLAGAAAGAVSDPCQVNLGDPIWRNQNASREDYYRRCGHYPPP